jgi:hypothetical protein
MNAVDYMKTKGITDILFVNNIFAANTNMLIAYVDALRFGPVGLTTTPPPETEISIETAVAGEDSVNTETPITEETAAETTVPIEEYWE